VNRTDSAPKTWDAVAFAYDERIKRTKYFDFASAWIAERVHELTIQSEFRVLDLGCGTGLNVDLLTHGGWKIQADGVDISLSMLERARVSGLYRQLHAHDLHLPLTHVASDEYDLIIAFGVFEFLSNPYVCLAECRRLLKKNGTLWATFQRFEAGDTGSPPRSRRLNGIEIRGISAGEILHAISNLSLKVIELKSVTGYVTQNGFACPYYALHARKVE
jgi:SAM-dependent methyltransferase